jgi:hypothetical protein
MWADGWDMADETPADRAIMALQAEIKQGHIIVSSNGRSFRRGSPRTEQTVVRLISF